MDILTQCRACQEKDPYLFLPMGNHPPANMFVRPEHLEHEQPVYPLNTQVCLNCGLIQIADQVPENFFQHYLYVPSWASTMHSHFTELAKTLEEQAGGGLIVDIGCNDGLMLAAANRNGSRTLGIDPAANLAKIARERCVDIHLGYFNRDTAAIVRDKHGPAKVIVASNTVNHIGDLHGFVESVMILLEHDGTLVIEVPWAKDILETNQFDNVYHEHLSEMSLLSIVKLGEFFDLVVVDVHRLRVHGGSMRIFLRRQEKGQAQNPTVAKMLSEELDAGLLKQSTYVDFAARVDGVKGDLLQMLADLKANNLKVAGYGAAAKGNTLLNYFDIGRDTLDFLVDRNPLKQGLFSPGKKIPIFGPEAIEKENPDVLLVLAWNFFDEIREQQSAFERSGGRFLVPLPTPRMVGA